MEWTKRANSNAPQSSNLGVASVLTGATLDLAEIRKDLPASWSSVTTKYTAAAYARSLESENPWSSQEDDF